jgi:DNA-binding beta-propeller fold protein YncE
MRYSLVILVWALLVAQSAALTRDLIVINGLGETADFVNLTDSTITQNVATLGLAPNDFLVGGEIGVAINSTSNDLYFFELPSMTPNGTLFLGSGRNPYTGALIDSNTALITNLIASTVTKVDLATQEIIGEYNVGKSPEGVAMYGSSAYICITNFDFGTFTYGHGYVQEFDLATNTVMRSIPAGTNPQDIALGYDGHLYVICTGDYATQQGIVYRIDPAGLVRDSLPVGGSPGGLAIARSGMIFLAAGGFAGHGEIFTVDWRTFSVVRGQANPIYTDLGVIAVTTISDSTVVSCNFSDNTITEIAPSGRVLAHFRTGDGPVMAAKYPACYLVVGDADGSGEVDISDAVFLINYIFAGGPPPVTMSAADINCDAAIDIGDAVFAIQYIFAGGPAPCGCAD